MKLKRKFYLKILLKEVLSHLLIELDIPMYRFGSPPNYNPKPEESIEAMAKQKGMTAEN